MKRCNVSGMKSQKACIQPKKSCYERLLSDVRVVGSSQCSKTKRLQSQTNKDKKSDISATNHFFFVIWLQILAWLAEIHQKTCLPSFSHKLFRAAKFLAYIYSPNSRSWVTKFTSKWLMMKLNCWKWFVQQQWCSWPPISNNFSDKTLPLRFKGFWKALSRHWLPINLYFMLFFLNLFG